MGVNAMRNILGATVEKVGSSTTITIPTRVPDKAVAEAIDCDLHTSGPYSDEQRATVYVHGYESVRPTETGLCLAGGQPEFSAIGERLASLGHRVWWFVGFDRETCRSEFWERRPWSAKPNRVPLNTA